MIMSKFLMIKEQIKLLYSRHSNYANYILRFLLTLFSLIVITYNVGFNPTFSHPAVIIIISLISAVLPLNIDVIILLLFVLLHLFTLSPEVAIATAIIFFVMYILYFRYTFKEGLVVILLPILFFLKIPYVIPIVMGIIIGPISIVPVTFGTIIYFILAFVSKNKTLITNMSTESGITKMTMVFEAVFNNKLFLLTFFSFLVIIMLVCIIKKLSIDYATVISIIIGGVANIVIMLLGYIILDLKGTMSVAFMIIGSVISILIAYIVNFIFLSVDYSRSEYAQFEDDEYYYYVKAIPKVNITTKEVNVKRINIQNIRRKQKKS